ncbi:MAG: SDR family oxidoreductase [Polaribacter sp.]
MELGLKGKVALVTASSGGIGLEIAKSLAEANATVIVNGRTQKSVDNAINLIKVALSNVELELLTLVADISTKNGCNEAIAKYPDIDILVNNLGIYESVGFYNETDEDWHRLFETNVMSGVRLSRSYLEKMIAKKTGRVVFISSESAISPAQEMVHYSATKTMQLGISRALAELTKGTKVTVNSVLPGPTKTGNVEKFVEGLYPELSPDKAADKFIKENRPSSLIQRFINPKEIGDIVTFVCSERASVINGSNIRADGGLVRSAF